MIAELNISQMMIDTISDINLLNKKIFDRLPPLETKLNLTKLADNTPMLNLMKIATPIKMTTVDSYSNINKTATYFYVLPLTHYDCSLGLP
jgi:hypothetical protein